MIRCSLTSAVSPFATLPSRRPSIGWSTRLASSRGRDVALACTICGTRLRCVRCKAAQPAEAGAGRTWRHSRPTWATSTSTRPTGIWRPRPTSCAMSPRPAKRSCPVKPSALMLEQIDAGLVSAFLEHLEDKRKNAAVTRNVRLAAIKSFFRFLEYRQPAGLEQIRRVLAIPFKKTDMRLVPYLLRDELQAVLDAPDPATRDGIRDRAMLHVAVSAGLRVSELTGLKIDDIDLPSMSIRVLGKGRRERTLPLWKPAAAALRAWLAIRGQVATPEVFVDARGEPLSRWGFAYLLNQHVATAARKQPGLAKKRVSPHVLRHTCAMVVLQATGDIRKVSLWLVHATLTTTEVYTRGDPTEKLDAMEAIVPPHLRRGVFQPTDKLIALLKRAS